MRAPPGNLLLLVLFGLVGCSEPSLVGFPEASLEEIARLRDPGEEDLRAALIENGDGTQGDILRRRYTVAHEILVDTYLSLANERDDLSQLAPARHLTHLYPRLTSPHLATPLEEDPKFGWLVPVVLAQHYYTSSAPNTLALLLDVLSSWSSSDWGVIGSAEDFSYWLKPMSPGPSSRVRVSPQFSASLPQLREDGKGVVLGVPKGFEPGFYDLLLLPGGIEYPGSWVETLISRNNDNWPLWLERLAELALKERRAVRKCLRGARSLKASIEKAASRTLALEEELEELAEKLDCLLDALMESEGVADAATELKRAAQVFVASISPARVLLDDPAQREEGFWFVAAADLQYGGDMTAFRRFLALMNPGQLPDSGLRSVGDPANAYPEALLKILRDEVQFVVFAGDLADGQAGSSPVMLALNVLGVLPPNSPYTKGGREFHHLARELQKFNKPFLAIPGNHDGFVGYGGLLNEVLDLTFGGVPWAEGVSDFIPPLVSFPGLFTFPRYDGLYEWTRELGSRNIRECFRGYHLLGLNTFDLTRKERAGVGAVAFNWGGGVTQGSARWFDLVVRDHARRPDRKRQLVFMHHDPRGALPSPSTLEEGGFGRYDLAHNLLQFPFEQLGLGHSSVTGFYVPLITPLSNYGLRLLDQPERFQQEWMMRNVFDTDCYGAKSLVNTISRGLSGKTGIEALFFAHDDVPLVTQWADQEGQVFQPARAGLDPTLRGDSENEWDGWRWEWWEWPILSLVRLQTDEPPSWGRELRVKGRENATVVRLDDVGNAQGAYHGFHLVHVVPGRDPEVRWVPLHR